MGRRSFLRGGFVRVKTVMGLEPFEDGNFVHEVASNRLKIGQQAAHG